MARNIIVACSLLLIVASCGTRQEQCIRRNTAELHTVTQLLQEVEGNLARGYAWEERSVTDDYYTLCRRAVRDKDGEARIISYGCWRDRTVTERFRAPIDPVAEARKAEALQTRKAALSSQVPQIIAACKKAFPDDG